MNRGASRGGGGRGGGGDKRDGQKEKLSKILDRLLDASRTLYT